MGPLGMEGSTPWDDLVALPFPEDRPSEQSAKRLYEELIFQQATQVYMLALPAVNMISMRDGSEAVFGSGYHVLAALRNTALNLHRLDGHANIARAQRRTPGKPAPPCTPSTQHD